MTRSKNRASRQCSSRLATAITSLAAVLLLSWAAPTYDVTATISEVETMGPLSMIDKALSVSEASAHRGSKAYKKSIEGIVRPRLLPVR